MTSFHITTIDTETQCGMALEDWPATFNVTWDHQALPAHPDGPSRGWTWTVKHCEFYGALLGDRATDRDALIEMVGASEVAAIEQRAADYFAENGPDMEDAA